MGKRYAKLLVLGASLILTTGQTTWADMEVQGAQTTPDPLEILITGNERFYLNQPLHPHQTHEQLLAVSKEQHPLVAILGCSDSRVPPELIFDQGLGDVFDIRVAGNALDPMVLGSLEYAVEHLHVPLIVVMGHERCGAIQAALDHENPHNHINSIIRALAPAVRSAHGSSERAVKNNVNHVLRQLSNAPFFRKRLDSGDLKLVGGYYHLDSGVVELIPVSSGNIKR